MIELVLGIDGGGTRTRAQLADFDAASLATGEAGTSNPLVHGIAAAQHELELAITRAFENAGVPRQRVAALVMGLGGAGRTQEQLELKEWTRTLFAGRVAVKNDGEIALAAGTRENWGVALIAGTGSFAWGRSWAGEVARAGGWGYMIGDEGSGYDLARQALRAATQYADGRGSATHLLEGILKFWDLRTPQDLITQVYRSGLTHKDIAHLAPIVIEAAKRGDKVALELVNQAVAALAAAVAAVSTALKFDRNEFPLALTGGLALGSPLLQDHLQTALQMKNCHPSAIALVSQPVIGAVRLAIELAGDPYG